MQGGNHISRPRHYGRGDKRKKERHWILHVVQDDSVKKIPGQAGNDAAMDSIAFGSRVTRLSGFLPTVY